MPERSQNNSSAKSSFDFSTQHKVHKTRHSDILNSFLKMKPNVHFKIRPKEKRDEI